MYKIYTVYLWFFHFIINCISNIFSIWIFFLVNGSIISSISIIGIIYFTSNYLCIQKNSTFKCSWSSNVTRIISRICLILKINKKSILYLQFYLFWFSFFCFFFLIIYFHRFYLRNGYFCWYLYNYTTSKKRKIYIKQLQKNTY